MKIIIKLNPNSADLPNAIARIKKLIKLEAVELIEQSAIEKEEIKEVSIKEHTGKAPESPKKGKKNS